MAAPALREAQHDLWEALAGHAPASCVGRFEVYTDAYRWRLQDALREDYPRLASLVGAERFDVLTRAYLSAHPSEHPSLRHLGDRLPAFLARHAATTPYLTDLARLELARTNAFDAPDCEPIGLDVLRAVPAEAWPRLVFEPSPSLTVLTTAWPAHELWEGSVPAGRPPSATALRVWRASGWSVLHAVMDARAGEALRRLVAGESFASMCAAFGDLPDEEAAAQAVGVLAGWVEDGVVVGCSAGATPWAP